MQSSVGCRYSARISLYSAHTGAIEGPLLYVTLLMLPCTVVVVLTFTRIIEPVVTGQAPVTLEWKSTQGKKQCITW